MNIQDLKTSLDYMFKAQVTPFIWGHAGIGKSTVVKQYAQDKGYKFFPFYLGTQSDIGDILGLASFVKDKNGSEIATTFATPIWLKDTIDYCNNNPDSGAVIFLDEFNRARRDILNGMFSLALDKTFHMIKLPNNCHVVAAGNPPTDEYYVTDINETALMARFVHIKLEPSFNEWVSFAKATNCEPTLISFLQEQPDLIEDHKSNFSLPVKVDRRSYERIDRLFKAQTPGVILDQLMLGIIGAERLVAYKQHLTNADKPLTADEVFQGHKFNLVEKWSNPIDVKSSLVSNTCDNIYDGIEELSKTTDVFSKDLANNLLKFLEIVPKEQAFTLLKKLQKTNYKPVIDFIRDANYAPRLVVLAKAARGIQ